VLGSKHVGLEAWRTFLSEVVTPRFPEGMTVLEAYGRMQHRDRFENAQVMRLRTEASAEFFLD
jgi:hypothetical protein